MMQRGKEEGFVLITTAVCLIAMIGIAGLAIDLGRTYIAKNESQTYADSAALAATLELDGTSAGLTRARTEVTSNPNKWNFKNGSFSGSEVTFSTSSSGPWESAPSNPRNYRYARVSTTVSVPLTFMRLFTADGGGAPVSFLLTSTTASTVRSVSGAGQEPKTRFEQGLFPFSPYAHSTTGPHYGLTVGGLYTLRWASNFGLNQNTCSGDNDAATVALASSGSSSERGYIEQNSANVIRKTIEEDYQSVTRQVGDTVDMTGGAKQSQLDSLRDRINQDSNTTAATYDAYVSAGNGNGRRLVAALINTGHPNYTAVQVGAFFLRRPSDYQNGANNPWCAEYVGAWVQGSNNRGAADSGAYVARLVP